MMRTVAMGQHTAMARELGIYVELSGDLDMMLRSENMNNNAKESRNCVKTTLGRFCPKKNKSSLVSNSLTGAM
jgi:hypothetical protein